MKTLFFNEKNAWDHLHLKSNPYSIFGSDADTNEGYQQ